MNHFNSIITVKSGALIIISLMFYACTSDDNIVHKDKASDSFIELTFEGGDYNSESKEIRIDDEYYYYETADNNVSSDAVSSQMELEEYSYFANREGKVVKYRFKINLSYIESESLIVDYDIQFGEFLEADEAIYATVYYNDDNSIQIDNFIIQDGYVKGNFEGFLYNNTYGPDFPNAKEMKITNGKFKMKLE